MTELNTTSEYISLGHNEVLEKGKTYYYTQRKYDTKTGRTEDTYVPVTMVSSARYGEYGDRLTGSDGIARYTGVRYSWCRGRNRSDRLQKTDLKFKQNPHYLPQRKPFVQLSLFDFSEQPS